MPDRETGKLTPADIRKARAFLRKHDLRTEDVSPKSFAATAKRTGKKFMEILKTIAFYQMGGQGGGQSPKAEKFISKKQRDVEL